MSAIDDFVCIIGHSPWTPISDDDLSPFSLAASETPSTPPTIPQFPQDPSSPFPSPVPTKVNTLTISYAIHLSNLPTRCEPHELVGFIYQQSHSLGLTRPQKIEFCHPDIPYCPGREAHVLYDTLDERLEAMLGLTKGCKEYHGRKLKFAIANGPLENGPRCSKRPSAHPRKPNSDPRGYETADLTTDDDRESEVEVVAGKIRSSRRKGRRIVRERLERKGRKRLWVDSEDEDVTSGLGRTAIRPQKMRRSGTIL